MEVSHMESSIQPDNVLLEIQWRQLIQWSLLRPPVSWSHTWLLVSWTWTPDFQNQLWYLFLWFDPAYGRWQEPGRWVQTSRCTTALWRPWDCSESILASLRDQTRENSPREEAFRYGQDQEEMKSDWRISQHCLTLLYGNVLLGRNLVPFIDVCRFINVFLNPSGAPFSHRNSV